MTGRTTLNHRKIKKVSRNNTKSSQQLSSSPRLLGLPQALLTEILGHVVSSSYMELFNIKSTCKDLYQIPEEEEAYIYRQICLEKFPVIAWQHIEKHSQFFKRCHDNKNPEALYREGVVQYFGRSRLEIAIKCLKEAANLGHMGAHYAMGVIYIFSGDELMKQRGMGILGEIMKSKATRVKLKDYRAHLKHVISRIWKNPLIFKGRRRCCTVIQHEQKKKKNGWLIEDEFIQGEDEDGNICEACASDFEIQFIRGVI